MDSTTIDTNSAQDDGASTRLAGTPHLHTADALSNTNDSNSTPLPTTERTASSAISNSLPSFQHLPNEVLEHILDYLVHDSAKLLPIDQRASLSTESFVSAPPRYLDEDQNNLGKFRSLCKKSSVLGRSRQFTRVNIRFSIRGLDRIRKIAKDPRHPELAPEIRKISYMVHDIYPQNRVRFQEILHDAQKSLANCKQRLDDLQFSRTNENTQSSGVFRRLSAELARCRRNEQIILDAIDRAEEQRQIIEGKLDEQALVTALSSFKNLQQIRLMRNVDELDRNWENFLNTSPILRNEFRPSRWQQSCERAMMILARAYAISKSTAYRLSSRFMDPQPEWLQEHISETTIPKRLTCLELQIDDPSDLNKKMRDLSGVFHTLFHTADKMEGLHIGLCRPISVPLEDIFHNVTWPHLMYIGFSKWNLPSDEIINFIHRHKGSLRSVRFREVRLRKGRWMEIVKFLRLELRLKWVSFRQVGYDPRIGGGPVPEAGYGGGFAMLRGPPDDEYETSSEDSDDIGGHAGDGLVQSDHEGENNQSENDEPRERVVDDNPNDGAAEGMDVDTNPTEAVWGHQQAVLPPDINENAGFIDEVNHDSGPESPSHSAAGDSEVGDVNPLALDDRTMVQHSSAPDDIPPNSHPHCYCENGYGWGDLEDDDHGLDPTKVQWKRWERWVIKGCLKHDPEHSEAT